MLKFRSNYLSLSRLRGLKPRAEWFKDSFIFWGSVLSFLLIIILFLIILFKLQPSSELSVVHYNVLVGVDTVKIGWYFYLLPAVALIVWIYNLILAKKFHHFEAFASYQLTISSILVSAILLGAALALTYLP